MTPTAVTTEALDEVVGVLLLVETLHDPRAPHGTRTTPDLAAGALSDVGIHPTPALVEAVMRLVAAGRIGGVSAA